MQGFSYNRLQLQGELFDFIVAQEKVKEKVARYAIKFPRYVVPPKDANQFDGSKPSLLRKLFRQMVGAMHHCHHNKIIHRDLKPENLLLYNDPDGINQTSIKIVDFGFASIF